MIGKIAMGMTLKCLSCHKPIKLTDDTFKFTFYGEYVKCPDCNMIFDIQAYHINGEIAESEVE
jgi:DNA-directed RNA polymerase subunit RPC12/RpoP